MPRNLIGRWNLRVSMVYKGLLWLGALQVDPGYEGLLYCPLFNLSSRDVTFKLGEAWALIDFVKTTEFIEGASKPYGHIKRTEISDYNMQLQSGLFTKVAGRMDKMEEDIKNFQSEITKRLEKQTAQVFTLLGILITALSILIILSSPSGIEISNNLSLSISVFALILAIFALSIVLAKKRILGVKKNNNTEKSPDINTLININLFKRLKKKQKKI